MREKRGKRAALLFLTAVLFLNGCNRGNTEQGLFWGGEESRTDWQTAGSDAAGESAAALETGGNRYARGVLDSREQEVYDRMAAAVADCEPSVITQGVSEEEILRAGEALRMDWPEFFWLSGGSRLNTHTLNGIVMDITYYFEYSMGKEELPAAKKEVEAAADRLLSGISDSWTDYEKVKAVYDRVILQTDYQEGQNDQSMYHVITKGEGVCAGYARTVQYLLNRLGIFCTFVSGTAEGGSHAWNLVRLDGDYYYLDPTWGDPVFSGETEAPKDFIDYSYFCVTSGELFRTHQPDGQWELPVCTATACNYFVKNNLLFSGYEKERLQQVFSEAAAEEKADLVIRFTDSSVRSEVMGQLVDEKEIYGLLELAAEQNPRLVTDRIQYLESEAWNGAHFRLLYEEERT